MCWAFAQFFGRNFLPEEEERRRCRTSVTKNFLAGTPRWRSECDWRSLTLDGTPHTIVGVLPNVPATWFAANPTAEVWTTKPFQISRFSHEQLMRGSFFLRVVGRPETGDDRSTSARRIAIVGRELSCPISEQHRQRILSRRCGLCLKTLPGISARASLHFSPR